MAKLKEGVILRPYGPASLIDNDNITDEIAQLLLDSGRAEESDFAELPGKEKKAAKVAPADKPVKPRTAKQLANDEKQRQAAAEKRAKAEQAAAEKENQNTTN